MDLNETIHIAPGECTVADTELIQAREEIERLRGRNRHLSSQLRPAAEGESGQYVPMYVIDANYREMERLRAIEARAQNVFAPTPIDPYDYGRHFAAQFILTGEEG